MLTHHRLTSNDLLIVLKALSGGGESFLGFGAKSFLFNSINITVNFINFLE